METATALAGILAVLALGVISPGPSFLLVARTAVARSRRAAVASAFGMASGATVLSMVALLGLHAVLQRVPVAYMILRLAGGIYLLYLAWKVWSGAKMPIRINGSDEVSGAGFLRHFAIGVGTMVSNPKAAVQYGVIFAAMLPASPSPALTLAIPPGVFLLELTWYLVVAFALSATHPRNTYLRAKAGIDRATGTVLGLLGIRLLISSK
jgi:threonine/homoserine/homoserine lactone efflux protein